MVHERGGPGRFYHPGMFPIIHRIIADRKITPGAYDLSDFVPNRNKKDPSLNAGISHYITNGQAPDYVLRALVFGNESANISGQVLVNPDGSKTFKQIEIQPWDTQFNFDHKTDNYLLEIAREVARRRYDPHNVGISYDIQYRGVGPRHGYGRIYDPFTDKQLDAALRNSGKLPPWLLPSITAQPSQPSVGEHLQYLRQVGGNQPTPATSSRMPPAVTTSPGNQNPSGLAGWIASLAGVDAADPAKPQRQPNDQYLGLVSGKPMQFRSVQPSIHFPH